MTKSSLPFCHSNEAVSPKMFLYRDAPGYYADIDSYCFETRPHLPGLGCGGGGCWDEVTTLAQSASKHGYRIIVVGAHRSGTSMFPLNAIQIKRVITLLTKLQNSNYQMHVINSDSRHKMLVNTMRYTIA